MGLSISIDYTSGSGCCSEATELVDGSCPMDEEDEKNCCNTVCDCLCCGHIFSFDNTKMQVPAENKVLVKTDIIPYAFSYLHNFSTGIWQPPRTAEN